MGPRGAGVAAGCALGFATGWNVGNLGGVTSDLARAYGVGLATVGLFTTALFLTHMALQVPGGRITDRVGPRSAGAGALGCIVAGNALALAAPAPGLAVAGRLLTGVGTAVAFIAGNAIVRLSGGSHLAQGVFGGVGLGAGGVAIAVVPHLEQRLGWRAPYWSSIALALVAAVLLAAAPAGRGAPPPAARGARGVVGDPALRRLAVMYAASFGLSVVAGNWVVELLTRHGAAAHDTAAAVGSLTLLLGVVTRPLGGWVLRHRAHAAQLAVRGSLVAGAAGTVALLASGPVWLAVLGGALVGVGAGIPFAPSFSGAAHARADAPAAAVGFVNAVANAVILVGTPLVGLSFSLSGHGRPAFAVIAVLWLVALTALPDVRSAADG